VEQAGRRLGFLNDDLYALAASPEYSSAFHDVTVGNNAFQGPGFPAASGYDASRPASARRGWPVWWRCLGQVFTERSPERTRTIVPGCVDWRASVHVPKEEVMARTALQRIVTASCAAALVVGGAGAAGASPGKHGGDGSVSSDPAYLVPATSGVSITPLLTAGDVVDGYTMVGLPDGLGAFDNGDGTFTLLANHELSTTQGVARAHGGIGSFVSRWVIDKKSLEVLSGSDQIRTVYLASPSGYVATPGAVLNRLCSADLAAPSAYYDTRTRTGYEGRIFTNGEEGDGGRAFAHVVETGDSYELPALGNAEWENVVANPSTGQATVVVGTADTGGGEIHVYAGTKQADGNPVEQAGLTNGTTLSVSVPALPDELGDAAVPDGPLPFSLVPTGTGTGWDRPEDGAWDPQHPDDFYFVTTASITKHSRLWKLHFTDAAQPSLGGTVELVLEGPSDPTVGPKMLDNITVSKGSVYLQEDPGNAPYLAGVYRYDIRSGELTRVADFDPERFIAGGSVFDTQDEESSGIIPVPFLGPRAFLLTAQNHTNVADPEQVQKGQFMLLRDWSGRGSEH